MKYNTDNLKNEMLKKFKYLNISKDNMKREIKKVYKTYCEANMNINEFDAYFEEKMNLYVYKLLNNGHFIEIVTNYINTNKLKNKIFKISELFITTNYIPTIDNYIDLIKNNNEVNEFITKLMKKKFHNSKEIDEISLSKYDTTYERPLIDAYASINDITIIEEEIDLSYLNNFLYMNLPKNILSIEEERAIIKRIKNNDMNAKKYLVEHNLRLIIKEAYRYRFYNIEIEDIIEEGCIGLLKAVNKYDLDSNCRFSTYATWWINQAIGLAVKEKFRTVKIPKAAQNKLNKMKKIREDYKTEFGEYPTNEYLAKKVRTTSDRVTALFNADNDYTYLNMNVGESDSSEIGEFIEDEKEPIENTVIENIIKEEIKKILDDSLLSEREKEIVKYRYGIDRKKTTLRGLESIFNISNKRISQIEKRALEKLREDEKYIAIWDCYKNDSKITTNDNESSSLKENLIKYKKILENYKLLHSLIKENIDNNTNFEYSYKKKAI